MDLETGYGTIYGGEDCDVYVWDGCWWLVFCLSLISHLLFFLTSCNHDLVIIFPFHPSITHSSPIIHYHSTSFLPIELKPALANHPKSKQRIRKLTKYVLNVDVALSGGITQVEPETKKSSLSVGVGVTIYCLVGSIDEVCFFLSVPLSLLPLPTPPPNPKSQNQTTRTNKTQNRQDPKSSNSAAQS